MDSRVGQGGNFDISCLINHIEKGLDEIGKTKGTTRSSVKTPGSEVTSPGDVSLVARTSHSFSKSGVGKESEIVKGLCSDIRAVKLAIKKGKITNPEELRKVSEVVKRVLEQLENVDRTGSGSGARLEKLVRNSHRINRLVAVTQKGIPLLRATKDGRIRLIRKNPKIKNLVLTGGGAKGIGYGPALGELEKAGELDHLEQIVGSSTGAVTGLFLASGLTPEEIGKLVDELKKDDVTGKCKDFEKKYPGLLELRGTGFSATKALRLADKKTALSVRSYLNRNWETIEEKHKDGTIKEDEYNRLQELRRQTSGKHPPRSTQMITFKDLAILHRVAPTQFKELTITGWDKTKRELIYFNKETTPGMPIALAGRISMAMPPIFKAVVYDPKDGKGVREFCDGGIGSNVPLGGVHGKEKGSKKKALAHTMVLAFDGFGKAQKRMEGTQSKTDKLFGRFRDKLAGRLLLGNPEYHKTTETDRENIHQLHRYRNVFVVGHGEMGTRDFDASDKMRAAAKEDAAKRAVEQIDKRKKRFLRKDFKDMDAVYEALTEDEKAAILASPPPLPKVGDPTSELEYELYQLVESKKRG